MTTIRQLFQTSPAKANVLFAKLAETSGNAVKTRERLFSELQEELELQMRLEEQHLFPVLRKRKETKDLVSDALDGNKQARKLLAELERTPTESEAFASKVAELRQAFQQHVRDERKEFLPAVLKALDDEEAGAIVEKIEGAKADLEEAKRAEAEQRRAAARDEREKAETVARQERERIETVARQEREQVETVRQTAESIGNVVRVGTEVPQRVAATARDAVQSGLGSVVQLAQKATDFGMSSFSDATRRWHNAAASMTAVAQANTGLALGYQAMWREAFQLAHQATQERTQSVTRLMTARSPQHLLEANMDLVKREMQMVLDGQARLSQLSAEAVRDAKQRLEDAASAPKEGEDAAGDQGRQSRRAA